MIHWLIISFYIFKKYLFASHICRRVEKGVIKSSVGKYENALAHQSYSQEFHIIYFKMDDYVLETLLFSFAYKSKC